MKLYDYLHLLSENDYRGQHTAPDKESGSPLYDLTLNGTYPNDIYSSKAKEYYGTGSSYDSITINIIQSYKNRKTSETNKKLYEKKKKKPITIYRAIPDENKKINKQIKELNYLISYYNKFKFLPIKNDIVYSLEDKYSIDDYSYDEKQALILKDINNQIVELRSQLKKTLKINDGDWVAITKQYAKEHGESNLGDYKIITKTIGAENLYTDGNSIHEWGYVANP